MVSFNCIGPTASSSFDGLQATLTLTWTLTLPRP